MIEAFRYAPAAPVLDAYNRFLLRRAFARVRVAGLARLRREGSAVIAANHSCWWDGCVDLFLTRRVLQRRSMLMMGDVELAKYRIFSSLGVFSTSMGGDPAHTLQSVRYATRELKRMPTLLWIYPQGAMLPARAPLSIRGGALAIAAAAGAPVIPFAQRYEFVRDDHPEVIARVGEPIAVERRSDAAHERLESAMRDLLCRVDADVANGELDEYEEVFSGAETRSSQLDRIRRTAP